MMTPTFNFVNELNNEEKYFKRTLFILSSFNLLSTYLYPNPFQNIYISLLPFYLYINFFI